MAHMKTKSLRHIYCNPILCFDDEMACCILGCTQEDGDVDDEDSGEEIELSVEQALEMIVDAFKEQHGREPTEEVK